MWHDIMNDGFYKWLIGHIILGQLIIYFDKQVVEFSIIAYFLTAVI